MQVNKPSDVANLVKRINIAISTLNDKYYLFYKLCFLDTQNIEKLVNKRASAQNICISSYETLQTALILLTEEIANIEDNLASNLKKICIHCHERVALQRAEYCTFCNTYAKQHNGDLPSEEELDAQFFKTMKFGPKK